MDVSQCSVCVVRVGKAAQHFYPLCLACLKTKEHQQHRVRFRSEG